MEHAISVKVACEGTPMHAKEISMHACMGISHQMDGCGMHRKIAFLDKRYHSLIASPAQYNGLIVAQIRRSSSSAINPTGVLPPEPRPVALRWCLEVPVQGN